MKANRLNTLPRKLARWVATGLGLLVVALAAPLPALASPPSPLLPGSERAGQIAGLFYIVLGIAVVVFVIVEALLIFAVIRYRRRHDDDEPEQVHGNTTMEIVWTVVPSLIMVLLFWLTLRTLQAQRDTPPDAMQVEVVGHQWFWEFRYDSGVIVTDYLRIPAGTPVELVITSKDVIHSFWVPQLGGKMDAIPGHTNTTWFEADRPGVYPGQCAEFCGLEHYAMLFDVEAMPPDEFDTWMAEEVASLGEVVGQEVPDMATVAPGDAAAGEQLFLNLGCTSCHSLDGSPLVGPSLLGVGARAGVRKEGYSAEQYFAESLVKPCEYVVEGFTCVMPSFGDRLTQDDIANLAAYLLEQ